MSDTCSCHFQCGLCKACIHKFECVCDTYQDKNLPCMHIHAVASTAFNELKNEDSDYHTVCPDDIDIPSPDTEVKQNDPQDLCDEAKRKKIVSFFAETNNSKLIDEVYELISVNFECDKSELENRKRTYTSQEIHNFSKKPKNVFKDRDFKQHFHECLSISPLVQNKTRLYLSSSVNFINFLLVKFFKKVFEEFLTMLKDNFSNNMFLPDYIYSFLKSATQISDAWKKVYKYSVYILILQLG